MFSRRCPFDVETFSRPSAREPLWPVAALRNTFVYRSGDALAAVSFEGASGPTLVAGMGISCAAWAILGFVLGRTRRA